MYLDGLNQVMNTLNVEIHNIVGRSQKGLTRGALKIRREAQKKTPVVTGNLRASAYTISGKGSITNELPSFKGKDAQKLQEDHSAAISQAQSRAAITTEPYAEVGFTAMYAPFIHENPNAGQTGKGADSSVPAYKRGSAVGEWKFLENAIAENHAEILRLITQEVKR